MADWAPRLAKGEALLLDVTRTGIVPTMPPMGMCQQCSDEELLAAIRFMSSSP
jgi:cytochrome c5